MSSFITQLTLTQLIQYTNSEDFKSKTPDYDKIEVLTIIIQKLHLELLKKSDCDHTHHAGQIQEIPFNRNWRVK